MNNVVENKIDIEKLIYKLDNKEIMLDSDIAKLYQVETKRINEAYRRNKDKFPARYCWLLNPDDLDYLWSQNATANINSKSRTMPRVFTEQGIYMLATILKSSVAAKVSIEIMDTFVKMRHYLNYNNDLLPNRIMLIENQVDDNSKKIQKLFDMFNPNEITKEFLIFNGEFFKSYYALHYIFDLASDEIILIDNYISKEILYEIKDINKRIIIITKNNNLLIKNYEKEFNNVKFVFNDNFHDRFIIIDKKRLFACGASFKDLGKKCFAINEMTDKELLDVLLNKLNLL